MKGETLTAVLTATENVSDALDDISAGFGKAAKAGEFTKESLDEVATGTEKLAGVTEAAVAALSDEENQMKSTSVAGKALDKAKKSVTISNEELAIAARQTDMALDKEGRGLVEAAIAADNLDSFLGRLMRKNIITAETADELADELDDVAFSSMTSAQATTPLIAKLTELGVVSSATQSRLDELSDEMSGVGSSALGASINIGPMNFALKDLFGTMAQLIPLAGALASSLLAIASAAVAAAAGIAMIFGGGVLAIAEGMAATSEDIEGQMEAIGEVLKKVGELFGKAMEPLMNSKTIEMFSSSMEEMASMVNYVAQAIDEYLPMFEAFFSEINTSFWDSFPSLVEETGKLLNRFMPILVDMFDWFMKKLPAAFEFFRTEGANMTDALADFFNKVMDFFVEFSEIGIAALQGILPAIGAVLSIMTMLADAINALPNGLIAVVALFMTMNRLMDAAIGFGKGLHQSLKTTAEMYRQAGSMAHFFQKRLKGGGMTHMAQAVEVLRGKFSGLQSVVGKVGQQFFDLDSTMTAVAANKIKNFPSALAEGFRGVSGKIKSAFKSIPPFTPTLDTKAFEAALRSDVAGLGPITMPAPEMRKGDFMVDGIEAAKVRFRNLRNTITESGGAFGFLSQKAGELRKSLSTMYDDGVKRLLNVEMTDMGLRDLDTGRFTTKFQALGKQIRKTFVGAGQAAYDSVKRLGGAIKTNIKNIGNLVWSYMTLIGAKVKAIFTNSSEATSMGVLQAAYAGTIGAMWGYISTLWTQIVTAGVATGANIALRQSLAAVALSGIPVIATAAGLALSFLNIAMTSGLAAAGIAALSFALDAIGLGLIIKAVVALIAVAVILVGVLGNLDFVTQSVGQGFNYLKAGLKGIFDFLVAVGIPLWNVLIDLFELIWAFIGPVIDGFGLLADALGAGGESGGFLASVMEGLGKVLSGLNKVWKGLWGVVGGFLDILTDVIAGIIIAPFKILAVGIKVVIGLVGALIDLWKSMIDWFTSLGPIQKAIGIIQSAIATLIGGLKALLDAVRNVFDGIVDVFLGAINGIISGINKLISGFNMIPGVDIGKMDKFSLGGSSQASQAFEGAKTTGEEVNKSAEGVGDSAKGLMSPGQKSVTNNITKNEYNFGDFNMLPEEKARVKGLVKQALRDANRNKRLEGGHMG